MVNTLGKVCPCALELLHAIGFPCMYMLYGKVCYILPWIETSVYFPILKKSFSYWNVVEAFWCVLSLLFFPTFLCPLSFLHIREGYNAVGFIRFSPVLVCSLAWYYGRFSFRFARSLARSFFPCTISGLPVGLWAVPPFHFLPAILQMTLSL